MRIATLVPGGTEICFALGLGPSVVGVSHACDFPPQAAFKPRLTRAAGGAAADPGGDGRAAGGPVSLVQATFERVRPDLILTQDRGPACAVPLAEVLEAARALPGHPRVVALDPDSIPAVLRTILEVGQLTGARERARELVGSLAARIDAVRGAVAGRPRPRVVCLGALDPLGVAGHWVPDQVEIAGGQDVLGVPGAAGRPVTAAELERARPDVIVCMPSRLRASEAQQAAAALMGLPGWGRLPAVRSGRVVAVDGPWYFSRPGPRVLDGTELLARLLHPEAWRGPSPLGTLRVGGEPG